MAYERHPGEWGCLTWWPLRHCKKQNFVLFKACLNKRSWSSCFIDAWLWTLLVSSNHSERRELPVCLIKWYIHRTYTEHLMVRKVLECVFIYFSADSTLFLLLHSTISVTLMTPAFFMNPWTAKGILCRFFPHTKINSSAGIRFSEITRIGIPVMRHLLVDCRDDSVSLPITVLSVKT